MLIFQNASKLEHAPATVPLQHAELGVILFSLRTSPFTHLLAWFGANFSTGFEHRSNAKRSVPTP
jgi:hypothetical protein